MGHQFCKAVLEASKNVLIERIFFLAKHSSSTSNFTSSLALTDEGLLLETSAFQFSFGGTSNFIKSFFFLRNVSASVSLPRERSTTYSSLETRSCFAETDECKEDPNICGPNTICRNLPGSYDCSCKEGFTSWEGKLQCKGMD